MTVEEIFNQISNHMVKGIMFHAQMSDYYNFLGLKGYSKCHEYHFICENYNFRKLSHYFLNHYDKIIQDLPTSNSSIIPASWAKYKRQDVDAATRKSAIQTGIENWVKWEQNTKLIYEKMYIELISLKEIDAAMEIKKYISDVSEELTKAKQKHIEEKSIDFDITVLIEEQDELYQKYSKEIAEIEMQ